MSCLGVHFALDAETVERLRSQPTDEERLTFLQSEIEEHFFESERQWIAQSDKAWNAIHRALTDGMLGLENGTYPLNHVILGGELLYSEDDYIMSLKTPQQVSEIAEKLRSVTADRFRRSYFQINPDECHFEIGQEDFEYTWENFSEVRDLFYRAAEANRFVLFTADQ